MSDPKVNYVPKDGPGQSGASRVASGGGSGFKVPIWLILLIVLQGGLMAGGFVWYKKYLSVQEERRVEAEKDLEEKKKIEALTFQFPLKPFSTNISSDTSDLKVLQVSMTFEVLGQVVQDEMKSRLFEVRDEVGNILSAKHEKDLSTPEKLRAVQQEIKHRMNKILEKGQVDKVYFTDFVVTERVQ